MGSSRSGLVGSPIACEGSKTGFYTDDFEDRHFKYPEEIRKASLQGADLRGANLASLDLYLVDLRDAKLDRSQIEHARRCGAILEDASCLNDLWQGLPTISLPRQKKVATRKRNDSPLRDSVKSPRRESHVHRFVRLNTTVFKPLASVVKPQTSQPFFQYSQPSTAECRAIA